MGTVFKKTVTKPLPAGAEIFVRKGQRFARWKDAKERTRTAAVTTGKHGADRLTMESRTYYAKYRDGGRIVRVVKTGCRDETAARSVLADFERRAELVRAKVITAGEDAAADRNAPRCLPHAFAGEGSFRRSPRHRGTPIDAPDERRELRHTGRL